MPTHVQPSFLQPIPQPQPTLNAVIYQVKLPVNQCGYSHVNLNPNPNAVIYQVKPAVNQCGYSIGNHNGTSPASFPGSMLGRDDETRAYCTTHGVTYVGYPLFSVLSL